MPRPPSDNDTPIGFRVPEAWLARCDAIIPSLSRPGITANRTDVYRHAMALGLDALEAEAAGKSAPVAKAQGMARSRKGMKGAAGTSRGGAGGG